MPRLNLSIGIDYGGRDELTRAVQAIAGRVALGEIAPEAICAKMMSISPRHLGVADPDLIIRTSGEFRVSNFLLWQAVYAEFDFPAIAWPDFTVGHFAEAVAGFRLRQRRFGEIAADPLRAAGLAGD